MAKTKLDNRLRPVPREEMKEVLKPCPIEDRLKPVPREKTRIPVKPVPRKVMKTKPAPVTNKKGRTKPLPRVGTAGTINARDHQAKLRAEKNIIFKAKLRQQTLYGDFDLKKAISGNIDMTDFTGIASIDGEMVSELLQKEENYRLKHKLLRPPVACTPTIADTAHMTMIQGTINRFAYNSFTIKLCSILVFCAMIFFSPSFFYFSIHPPISMMLMAVVIALPFVGFAFYDAYYLRMERAYRNLFNDSRVITRYVDERAGTEKIQSFVMTPVGLKDITYLSVMISITQIWFYLAQIAVLEAIVFLLII